MEKSVETLKFPSTKALEQSLHASPHQKLNFLRNSQRIFLHSAIQKLLENKTKLNSHSNPSKSKSKAFAEENFHVRLFTSQQKGVRRRLAGVEDEHLIQCDAIIHECLTMLVKVVESEKIM